MKEYAQVGEVNGGGKEQMVEEPEAEENTDEKKEGGDDNQARAGKEIREEVQEGSGSPERSGSPSGGAGWSMRLAEHWQWGEATVRPESQKKSTKRLRKGVDDPAATCVGSESWCKSWEGSPERKVNQDGGT